MDDGDQAPAARAPAVSSSAPPPPVPASLAAAPQPPPALALLSSSTPPNESKEEVPAPLPSKGTPRLRFAVELKAGETTIVSWKRLLRESGKGSASPSRPPAEATGAPDALAASAGPSGASVDAEPNDAVPATNRFSAVIEKIERLYMGKHSSDEEDLDDIPDDDQYDTEDSFIDDTELDEYFQIDKLATKHEGYFVNKGKLEHIEASSSPKEVMRKRRRKDLTELQGEFGGEHVLSKSAHGGNMRIKDAARGTLQVGRKLSHPVNALVPFGEHGYEKGRNLKHKSTASLGMHRKRYADFSIKPELSPVVRSANRDLASLPVETKDFDKHKAGHLAPRDIAYKSKRVGDSFDPMYQQSSYKGQVEFQQKKIQNGKIGAISTKVRRKEKYVVGEFSGANSSGSTFPMQAAHRNSVRVKEGSSIRPKGTTLERAIRDLEKIVAECRPPSLDVQDVDPAFQGVKRRLPREVKQKLAKVARLSANQGKISKDELIDRLMGILGHLVQRRTLKRNMKEMVELGLSAKQEKADKYQQIKKEVNEMIRVRVSQLKAKLGEQQDGSADAFQEGIGNDEKRTLKGMYTMDATLEDRICDLYDLFVEGMDEDKGPRSRKLYVELAELWPTGYMDNIGIKDAIYRSKERRSVFYSQNRVRDAERIKRKKLAAMRIAESNPVSQVRAGQERSLIDAGQALSHADKLASNQLAASSSRFVDPMLPSDSLQHGSKNPDKFRTGSVSTVPGEAVKSIVDAKKKKRKAEVDSGEIHVHSSKVYSQNVPEKHKFPKYADETIVSHHPNSNTEQLPDVPGSIQPS